MAPCSVIMCIYNEYLCVGVEIDITCTYGISLVLYVIMYDGELMYFLIHIRISLCNVFHIVLSLLYSCTCIFIKVHKVDRCGETKSLIFCTIM